MSDKEFGGNDDLSLPKDMVKVLSTKGDKGRYSTTYLADRLAREKDLTLPPATVQKIINEVLATNPQLQGSNLSFAKETRDVLIECCVEFITMLSSEANEIAEKDAKKTIACEHITKALEELGFGEYVPELGRVADEFKSAAAHRERKQTKIEQSGMSQEELLKMQEELLRSAGDKYAAAG